MIGTIAANAGAVQGGEIPGDPVADAVGAGGFGGGTLVAILDGEGAVFAGVLSACKARGSSKQYRRENG